MDVAYCINGMPPRIKKYQVAATVSNLGIPFLVPAAGGAGLAQGTTTGCVDMIGINSDLATYATAQVAGGDPEALVSVCINPDAVLAARCSGGATEGTALTEYAATSASTTGLDITTAGTAWNSPTYDEGSAYGYYGANAGKLRKITSVGAGSATVTVAFPQDIAVGDTFLRLPWTPFQSTTLQLTTNLYEADATIAVGAGATFRVVELQLQDKGGRGTLFSRVLFISDSHVLAGN